jgi:hypothetical protein
MQKKEVLSDTSLPREFRTALARCLQNEMFTQVLAIYGVRQQCAWAAIISPEEVDIAGGSSVGLRRKFLLITRTLNSIQNRFQCSRIFLKYPVRQGHLAVQIIKEHLLWWRMRLNSARLLRRGLTGTLQWQLPFLEPRAEHGQRMRQMRTDFAAEVGCVGMVEPSIALIAGAQSDEPCASLLSLMKRFEPRKGSQQ